MTVTVDPDFIYAMLKEFHGAVMAGNIGGTTLYNTYFSILQDGVEKRSVPLSCSVSPVPGGAKIVCSYHDTSAAEYTANGAAYNFGTNVYIYYLFNVSFPSVTKGYGDTLSVIATAVLTAG